jgi:hypothetical protein
MHYPLDFFNLIFDLVLSDEEVNRWRASEESKGEERSGRSCGEERLDEGHGRRSRQRNGRFDDLDGGVRGGAEGTIRTGDISVGMNVDSLNRSASDDQHNAQKREDENPRALFARL